MEERERQRESTILLRSYFKFLSIQDIEIAGGKYTAKVRLYLPHDFDERKKYPLLINVYAGPNSQQVI